jgi:uncharacterized repeat protein (TIGR01451 family)
MKKIINTYSGFILLVAMLLIGNAAKTQVNGFNITDPSFPTAHNLGSSFPVNISFNWTASTTSATVVINFNSSLVSYDPGCTASLPGCMSVSSTASQVTVTIANLSSCTNTGAISFNLCFRYLCPDSCTGVIKPALFTGTLTDNLSTTQTDNCTSNGILNNNVFMSHNFHSFNQMTGEITFRVCFNNTDCFKIKNPNFSISLSPALGTITSAYGSLFTYTVAGNIITPNTTAINQYTYECFYYVVKVPCNTGLGQTLTSNVTFRGTNCNVPNSTIKGPLPASFTIPATPLANANISVNTASTATYFYYNVVNTGNVPLNLTATHFLPLVHLKNSPNSVMQNTSQAGLSCGIKYYNCTLAPTSTFPLVGNGATDNNAPPTNTNKFDHTINNLLPGQSVSLYLYYDLTSSCSGPAGNPPYKDSIAISYNCVAPPSACIPCGPGGNQNPIIIYNPQPNMNCTAGPSITGCKNLGDTLTLCYEFRNNGDAALVGGVFNVQLPSWLQAIYSSVVYTGFSPSPTIVPASNIKFNLPTIPTGTATYKICFKAVVQPGATGGPNGFWSVMSGGNLSSTQYVCYTYFNICAFAAIGVDKKVKGSLNSNFANSATGNPNTAVDWEITVRNTGTIAVDNLVVIDRIPAIGNLTILGSPTSSPVSNQFNMQMLTAPTNINYTATYTTTQNICTTWPATGTPCNTGVLTGTVSNGGVKFTFNPTFTLAPGANYTFTFQTKIPAGTGNGLVDCNTVGFIAKSVTGGYTINPVESVPVCVEVVVPEVPPGGCCKDLLKKIATTQSVSNDVLTVNATLTAGPTKLTKVSVSLVSFEVKHPKDCDVCVKDPRHFGNITNPTSALPFNTVPANVPFSHLVQWKDSLGYSFMNGVPLNFSIPLPPRSPIACCCDTIDYCIRYTFTDTACVVCDTVICYRTYNGKDCKETGGGGNNGEPCNCSWNPVFNYEGGQKSVACGGSVTLPKGNIPVSLNPNFQCTPASQSCTPSGLTVTITNNTTGVTSILTGPNYNFTFLQSGNYTYNLSGSCGGNPCNCQLTVIIPQ